MRQTLPAFGALENLVLDDAEGVDMAAWARSLKPCPSAWVMLKEYEWVVLCSGISYRAAMSMRATLEKTGQCGHPHKDKAIAFMRLHHPTCWDDFQNATTDADQLSVIRSWPYMGGKALPFQLAKNLGLTCFCKPDVHLCRLAQLHGWENPQTMCEALARECGQTVAYVDTVLWFAAMKGWAYKVSA